MTTYERLFGYEVVKQMVLDLRKDTLLPVLLILSTVPLLLAQGSTGQSYVTFTSTSVEYHQETTTSTSTVTSTVLTNSVVIPVGFFRIHADDAQCYYWFEPAPKLFNLGQLMEQLNPPLSMSKGQEISVELAASSPIFFFIMNSTQFHQFLDGWNRGKCDAIATSASMLATGAVTSYSLNWVAPKDGGYRFVFLNPTYDDVSISVKVLNLQFAAHLNTYEVVSTRFYTSTRGAPTASTQTGQPPSLDGTSVLYIAVVVAALLSLVAIAAVSRFRKGK
jgi:hypothetical protein